MLLAVGALFMTTSFFVEPYTYFSEIDRLTKDINAQSEAAKKGLPPPEPMPAAIYSPEKARRLELAFVGGGFIFLAGAFFAALPSIRRRSTPET